MHPRHRNKELSQGNDKGSNWEYLQTQVLGLGYSLRNCSFISNNYSNHHALGKLAEWLVEKGMLAAAGEDDHRDHGGAGQQPRPVAAGSE